MLKKLCLGFILIALSVDSNAASARDLSRLAVAPVIDGIIQEQVWESATKIVANYEYDPAKGAPAPVKTVAYIYEDGTHLHVAFRAYDPSPETLTAHLSERDPAWGDDLLTIVLDTFNDERSAYEFHVNPLGVQMDMRMKDNSGWNSNRSWDAIWESGTNIDEEGWTAEMSIPLSVLRFENHQDKKTWGIAIFRAYQSDTERWLTDFKYDRSIECSLCQFNKYSGFESVKQGKNIQLIPSLVYTQTEVKDGVGEPWMEGESSLEPGLNVRWGITENSVINAALNPDFSQVEADAAQLDVNNPYSLFVSEKRSFFVDGHEYFESDLFNLVHTRNIVDPDLGLKLTGKSGGHSYGLMLANDRTTNFIIPGNQGSSVASLASLNDNEEYQSRVAVGHYKVDIGERSHLGVTFAAREGESYENLVASVVGKSWFNKSDSLTYQLVGSQSKNPLSLQQSSDLDPQQDGLAYAVAYGRDKENYALRANYEEVAAEFRADLGFITEAAYERVGVGGTIKTIGEKGDWIAKSFYGVDIDKTLDEEGDLLEDSVSLFSEFKGIFHSNTKIQINSSARFYENEFNPGGEVFNQSYMDVSSEFKPHRSLSLDISARLGEQIDYSNAGLGDFKLFGVGVNWNIGKHLGINLSHNYHSLDQNATCTDPDHVCALVEGERLFTAEQSDLRINYQFNIKSQIKFVVQYTDIERDPDLYLANYDSDPDNDVNPRSTHFFSELIYSYKLNSQSVFYLGYADKGVRDELSNETGLTSRSVFMKFSYAWQK